jgi:hypothetical protein
MNFCYLLSSANALQEILALIVVFAGRDNNGGI